MPRKAKSPFPEDSDVDQRPVKKQRRAPAQRDEPPVPKQSVARKKKPGESEEAPVPKKSAARKKKQGESEEAPVPKKSAARKKKQGESEEAPVPKKLAARKKREPAAAEEEQRPPPRKRQQRAAEEPAQMGQPPARVVQLEMPINRTGVLERTQTYRGQRQLNISRKRKRVARLSLGDFHAPGHVEVSANGFGNGVTNASMEELKTRGYVLVAGPSGRSLVRRPRPNLGGFSRLPEYVRGVVFSMVLKVPMPIDVLNTWAARSRFQRDGRERQKNCAALLRVCSAFHIQGREILYGQNTFVNRSSLGVDPAKMVRPFKFPICNYGHLLRHVAIEVKVKDLRDIGGRQMLTDAVSTFLPIGGGLKIRPALESLEIKFPLTTRNELHIDGGAAKKEVIAVEYFRPASATLKVLRSLELQRINIIATDRHHGKAYEASIDRRSGQHSEHGKARLNSIWVWIQALSENPKQAVDFGVFQVRGFQGNASSGSIFSKENSNTAANKVNTNTPLPTQPPLPAAASSPIPTASQPASVEDAAESSHIPSAAETKAFALHAPAIGQIVPSPAEATEAPSQPPLAPSDETPAVPSLVLPDDPTGSNVLQFLVPALLDAGLASHEGVTARLAPGEGSDAAFLPPATATEGPPQPPVPTLNAQPSAKSSPSPLELEKEASEALDSPSPASNVESPAAAASTYLDLDGKTQADPWPPLSVPIGGDQLSNEESQAALQQYAFDLEGKRQLSGHPTEETPLPLSSSPDREEPPAALSPPPLELNDEDADATSQSDSSPDDEMQPVSSRPLPTPDGEDDENDGDGDEDEDEDEDDDEDNAFDEEADANAAPQSASSPNNEMQSTSSRPLPTANDDDHDDDDDADSSSDEAGANAASHSASSPDRETQSNSSRPLPTANDDNDDDDEDSYSDEEDGETFEDVEPPSNPTEALARPVVAHLSDKISQEPANPESDEEPVSEEE